MTSREQITNKPNVNSWSKRNSDIGVEWSKRETEGHRAYLNLLHFKVFRERKAGVSICFWEWARSIQPFIKIWIYQKAVFHWQACQHQTYFLKKEIWLTQEFYLKGEKKRRGKGRVRYLYIKEPERDRYLTDHHLDRVQNGHHHQLPEIQWNTEWNIDLHLFHIFG